MDENLQESYEKANTFVQDNIEDWIKEYGLTEDQVKAIYEHMSALEMLGVDITTFDGWELVK